MNKSPGQFAKTLETKFLKNLSKCFSQLEGPPVSKSRREPWRFLYNLATGASTRKQVAELSRENCKKPKILENFLSLFRDWDIDPLVSRENLMCKLAIGGMWLDWPATKSPEQGNTVFEIFDIFAKTKDFPKAIKTLKNLFVFDQHIIEHVQQI